MNSLLHFSILIFLLFTEFPFINSYGYSDFLTNKLNEGESIKKIINIDENTTYVFTNNKLYSIDVSDSLSLISSNFQILDSNYLDIYSISKKQFLIACTDNHLLNLVNQNGESQKSYSYTINNFTLNNPNTPCSINYNSNKNIILITYSYYKSDDRTIDYYLLKFTFKENSFEFSSKLNIIQNDFSLSSNEMSELIWSFFSCEFFDDDNLFCVYRINDERLKYILLELNELKIKEKDYLSSSSITNFKLIKLSNKLIAIGGVNGNLYILLGVYYDMNKKIISYLSKVSNGYLQSNSIKTLAFSKSDNYHIYTLVNYGIPIIFRFIFTPDPNYMSQSEIEIDSSFNSDSYYLISVTENKFKIILQDLDKQEVYISTLTLPSQIPSLNNSYEINLFSEQSISINLKEIINFTNLTSSQKENLDFINKKYVYFDNLVYSTIDESISFISPSNGNYYFEFTYKEDDYFCDSFVIPIKVCYESCGSCNDYSNDSSDMKCTSCKSTYYPLFNNSNQCYSSIEQINYYYFHYSQDSESLFQKCNDKCIKCAYESTNESDNCITCIDPYFYDKETHNCIECNINQNKWYVDIDNDNKVCLKDNNCPYNYPKLLNDTNQCVIKCPDETYQEKENNICVYIGRNNTETEEKENEEEESKEDKIEEETKEKEEESKETNNKEEESKENKNEEEEFKEDKNEEEESKETKNEEEESKEDKNEEEESKEKENEKEEIIDDKNKEEETIEDNNDEEETKETKNEEEESKEKENEKEDKSESEIDNNNENILRNVENNIIDYYNRQLTIKQNNMELKVLKVASPEISNEKTNADGTTKSILKINLSQDNFNKITSEINTTSFYVLQVNLKNKNGLTDQIEYSFYDLNGEKIQIEKILSADTKITISNSINYKYKLLAENVYEYNKEYDALNYSNKFYYDVCSKFSDSNNNDVTIEDRRKYFFQSNLKFCESDYCSFISFDYNNRVVNCLCKIKTEINLNENDFDYIYPQFENNNSYKNENFRILKCKKEGKNNMGKNPGFWIVFILYIFELFFIIFSFKYKSKINNISNPPKNEKKEEIENSNSDEFSPDPKSNHNLKGSLNISNSEGNEKKLNSENESSTMEPSEKPKYIIDNYKYKSWIDIYISILTQSELLFFTFIDKDNSIKLIKITIFILDISLILLLSLFFQINKRISHIFLRNSNSYDFFYSLPYIICVIILTNIINYILKFIFIYNNRKKNITKKIILSVIEIVIIMFLWIHITNFCEIFINTKKHLLLDALIAFIIICLFSFVSCILYSIIMVLGIKYKIKTLCYLSNILIKL